MAASTNGNSHGIVGPVEKLKGVQDYHNWKFQVKMLLIHEDLWNCVTSEGSVDEKQDLKALAKICLCVSTAAYPHVRTARTAREAWDNLSKAYEDRGLSRRLGLLRTLFSMKYSECVNMNSYLSKIIETSQQLSDIGSPLDDDFVAVIMLSGLPGDYDPLIMTLENNNVKLSSDIVKAKLLQEDQRRTSNEGETALTTKKFVRCFRCKQLAHTSKYCPRANNNKKTQSQECFNNKNQGPGASKNKDTGTSKNGTFFTALSAGVQQDAWVLDSGATNSFSNNRQLFSEYTEIHPIDVNIANGDKLSAIGKGNIKIRLPNCIKTITNVYFVPNLTTNLLSVSSVTKKGHKIIFDSKCCQIVDCNTNDIVATARLVNNVYQLKTLGSVPRISASDGARYSLCSVSETVLSSQVSGMTGTNEVGLMSSTSRGEPSTCKETQELWHRRLAHLNSRSMYLLKNGMATGIDFDENNFQSCVACVQGKQTRIPFPKKSASRSKSILDLIHTDLCGAFSTPSLGGAKYFLTFTDDYTRRTFVYFLKSKNEVFENFKTFKALVENQTGKKIKRLRSDNGREYINNQLQAYLRQHGIVHETTVPYSPAQNGVSERANRTIIEKVRCMLQDAGLDDRFWAEAVHTAVYIKNRTPTKAVMGATPHEKWTGKKVDISHFKIFGCVAYALIHNRKKLDSKSKQYIFVGYCEESKGYRLVDPENPTTCIKSRDVVFFENKFHSNCLNNNNIMSYDDIISIPLSQNTVKNDSTDNTMQQSDNHMPESESLHGQCTAESLECFSDDIITKSRKRQRRQEIIEIHEPLNDTGNGESSGPSTDNVLDETYIPGTSSLCSEDTNPPSFESMVDLGESGFMSCMLSCSTDEPMTVQEAMNSKDADKWRAAMQDEYDSFNKNNCWKLVDPEEGQRPIKCKWVFKIKRDLNGKILRYKARLVAKGFTQRYGIDYQETFAPVVRYSTIRMLLALAVEYNLNIDQLDVKTAFLRGDLHDDVIMTQPEGFVIKGKEYKVYKLNKSVYGLKQAAKCWYDTISGVLTKKMSFQKSSVEPCVYFRSKDGKLAIVTVYVDDILLFTSSARDKKEIKDQLMREFEITDLGAAHEFLGMRIRKENGNITLDQCTYIKNILKRFKMEDCKPIGTPMEVGIKLNRAEKISENCEYRNLIGHLMYLAVCTRPDIAHAVSYLSQFNDCYSEVHWKAAKRVLRYLKGTLNYCLFFEKSNLNVSGFVDADWGSCDVDRKSYTGFVFKIGKSVVSWESRKQKTVALSSTEAEYMALSDACKEALFIRNFFMECLKLNCVITLYNDNQSAQRLCENSMFHARTKHIDMRHHFIRDIVCKNLINIKYLNTEQMTADILTKALVKDKFNNFVVQLNLKVKG